MVVYFSGTGNSRFAAEYLAKQLNDECISIVPFTKKGESPSLNSERPWVFVAPTYAWQMAHIMSDFIRAAELRGTREAYFVLTCGGDIGNSGKYTEQLCMEKGLIYRGTQEIVMPDNYILMFRAPEENEAISIIEKAKSVLKDTADIIVSNNDLPHEKKGIFEWLKSGPVNDGFYRFYVKPDGFWVTDTCISCGKCEEVCPFGNIRLIKGTPQWGKMCTHCMACICTCPVQSIEYGKKSKGKRRYQCPEEADK